MKIATKAALFSAIVFPGAGYFIVEKRVRGAVAFAITLAALSVLMVEAYHKAQIIAEKIVYGVIPLDIQVIREQIVLTPGHLSPETATYLSFIVGAVWLVGIVDCYRIGLAQQRITSVSNKTCP
ncbi:hypothetical protein [Alkalimarinus coralli]|uniref:hypothetical protein n=1 Tax=Alkalimarinus coralli TaxID=2935863 RepID=UPI00202B52E7|nr:hypothetical protein [Alkalimarinus coralli]